MNRAFNSLGYRDSQGVFVSNWRASQPRARGNGGSDFFLFLSAVKEGELNKKLHEATRSIIVAPVLWLFCVYILFSPFA